MIVIGGVLVSIKNDDLEFLANEPNEFWKGITEIGNSVFAQTEISSIEIPKGVKIIGDLAFSECKNLKSVKLPEGLEYIEAGAFMSCTNLEEVKLPASLKGIGNAAFVFCKKLKEIKIPEGIKSIDEYAFGFCKNLERVDIPVGVELIKHNAFFSCESLTSVIIPEGVIKIGEAAFTNCLNLREITIPKNCSLSDCFWNGQNLNSVIFNGEVNIENDLLFGCCHNPFSIKIKGLKNFEVKLDNGNWKLFFNDKIIKEIGEEFDSHLINFVSKLANSEAKFKFLPSKAVYSNIKVEDLNNFFQYAQLYRDIVNSRVGSDKIEDEIENDRFKACYALGLFSDDKFNRKRAEKFVREHNSDILEETFHQIFSGFNTLKFGYIKQFADFFFENSYDIRENLAGNLVAKIYNEFNEILKAHPNKEIITNTRRDKLTLLDAVSIVLSKKFEDVEFPNLALTISKYGYSQEDFDKLQRWFKIGIKNGSNITSFPDEASCPIKFKLLAKDDPLGAVLGEITDCCQILNSAGESCLRHGMTDPNGGFVVFKYEDRIIGQSWVWYNKKMKKLCFDNIEVPNSAKDLVRKNSTEFKKCLIRAANSISNSMKENGNEVEIITMGKGYNDFLRVLSDKEFKPVKKLSGGAPRGYTDINSGELFIPLAQAAVSAGTAQIFKDCVKQDIL